MTTTEPTQLFKDADGNFLDENPHLAQLQLLQQIERNSKQTRQWVTFIGAVLLVLVVIAALAFIFPVLGGLMTYLNHHQ